MTDRYRRHFEPTPEAVGEARRFLHRVLEGRVDPVDASDMVLAISELATNAVRHAKTPFDVVIEADGSVRIEVEDGSVDLPITKAPSGSGGRGLAILGQLCDRWGVAVESEHKCVWCERDLEDR
jgi:anti-sigma regulatory factor (Ser/Thr protein kinase)